MKKIRSEFLTETEAYSAMEKIQSYCVNVRISSYGDFYPYAGYNGCNGSETYLPDSDFPGFPETGSFGIGGFGMVANWNFGPFSLTDKYNQTFPHSHLGYDPSKRAALEADVADDNYAYVRDKLYSLGAISVS